MNKKNTKGKFFWLFFKISQFFNKNFMLKIIGFPIRIFYKILFNWIFGIDIPDSTKIGKGFNVYHGQGLVINSQTIIGKNVIVRQNTTIGNSHQNGGSPIIEDNVDIGANSVIIGEIIIGSNSVIAAGSIVIRNVEPNTIVAGNPARYIKTIIHV
jgi:putative colanic acid biosynthesis acetyltransferase WcaB